MGLLPLLPAIATCLVNVLLALLLVFLALVVLRYPFVMIGMNRLPGLMFAYGFCQQLSAVLPLLAALEAYLAATSPYPNSRLYAAGAGSLLTAAGFTLALHLSKHAARRWVSKRGIESLPDITLPLQRGFSGRGAAAMEGDESLIPRPNSQAILNPGYWNFSREMTSLWRPKPWWAMKKIVAVTDIPYYEGDGVKERKLDVLHRPDIAKGSPTLLYIHGGGWTMGDKKDTSLPLLYHFAYHMKWLVITVNYRLLKKGADVPWPGQLHDCFHALAWARSPAAEQYGGGGDFLAVCGDSAGAHLATLVGFTWQEERMVPPGAWGKDLRVDAVIDLYGVHDPRDLDGARASAFNEPEWGVKTCCQNKVLQCPLDDDPAHIDTWNDGSPLWWVEQMTQGVVTPAVPVFTLGVGHDTLIPIVDWRCFSAALKKMREETGTQAVCDLHIEMPKTIHGFNSMNSPAAFALTDVVERFLYVVACRAGTP